MANKWFKHFNDTLIGDSMQNILAVPKHGHQYVVLFFYILECLSRNHSESFGLDLAQVSRRLRLRLDTIRTGLGVLAEHTSLTYSEHSPNTCQIHIGNWLELQSTGDKIKNKNKIKKQDKEKDKELYGESRSASPPILKINSKSEIKKPPSGDEELRQKCREFCGIYATAYTARYGSRPDFSGKRQGQIKALVKGCESFPELCELVQVYVQMDDDWFKKKSHDIQTFAENLSKVRISRTHGEDYSGVEASLSLDKWAAEKESQQKRIGCAT